MGIIQVHVQLSSTECLDALRELAEVRVQSATDEQRRGVSRMRVDARVAGRQRRADERRRVRVGAGAGGARRAGERGFLDGARRERRVPSLLVVRESLERVVELVVHTQQFDCTGA